LLAGSSAFDAMHIKQIQLYRLRVDVACGHCQRKQKQGSLEMTGLL
jgi:hypothetical protein